MENCIESLTEYLLNIKYKIIYKKKNSIKLFHKKSKMIIEEVSQNFKRNTFIYISLFLKFCLPLHFTSPTENSLLSIKVPAVIFRGDPFSG